jgi:hypothetical protein
MKGPKRYDLGQIEKWAVQIVRLLDRHVVLLPELKATMIVYMSSHPNGEVSCRLTSLVAEWPVGTPHPDPPIFEG